MSAAPLPIDEVERLKALRSDCILDTPPEQKFDRLTSMATRLYNVPIALISLVDSDQQWLKSSYGTDVHQTDRKIAFCAHAIHSDVPLVVPDTRLDSRFFDHPLVTGAPGIRFYAGSPLLTAAGLSLGTLCLMDTVPHPGFDEAQCATLMDLAALVVDELELRTALMKGVAETTERMLTEKCLRASEDQLQLALKAAHMGIWDWDLLKGNVAHSEQLGPLLGLPAGIYPETYDAFLDCVHPEDRASVAQAVSSTLQGMIECEFEFRTIWPDGSVHWVLSKGQVSRDRADSPVRMLSVATDITTFNQARELRFEEQEIADATPPSMVEATPQSIADAVITTDAACLVQSLNPIAEVLTGWSSAAAQGLSLSEILPVVGIRTRKPKSALIEQMIHSGKNVTLSSLDTLLITPSGREYVVDLSGSPIQSSDGRTVGALVVFHDMTGERQATQKLAWKASHDTLTGLINRQAFEQHLRKALLSASQGRNQHILCHLDLDQFKVINDTGGHGAGDELLKQVGALLRTILRTCDIVARIGDDEFGLLLQHCALEQAQRIANDVLAKLQLLRVTWEGHTFSISGSIGIVPIHGHIQTLEELLSAAAASCAAAKDSGQNRLWVWQVDDEQLQRRHSEMQWIARIHQALQEDRFCLYHQPIVATDSSGVSNIPTSEVLLRLQDNLGNVISPINFLPAAERYGLMDLIDRWVVRTLFATQGQHCREFREAYGSLDHPPLFFVNLSGASINNAQFVEFVREQFQVHRVPPQTICFEITETTAIENLTRATTFIHALKALGCQFALDDFGSGASSFTYLKHLPVDYLKIDGAFIKNMLENPLDRAIVESINRIGHLSGLKTVAEFVENDAILEQVRALKIDYAQGYGIAKPRPLIAPLELPRVELALLSQ